MTHKKQYVVEHIENAHSVDHRESSFYILETSRPINEITDDEIADNLGIDYDVGDEQSFDIKEDVPVVSMDSKAEKKEDVTKKHTYILDCVRVSGSSKQYYFKSSLPMEELPSPLDVAALIQFPVDFNNLEDIKSIEILPVEMEADDLDKIIQYKPLTVFTLEYYGFEPKGEWFDDAVPNCEPEDQAVSFKQDTEKFNHWKRHGYQEMNPDGAGYRYPQTDHLVGADLKVEVGTFQGAEDDFQVISMNPADDLQSSPRM